jgi:endo-1,4-beta-xylanase
MPRTIRALTLLCFTFLTATAFAQQSLKDAFSKDFLIGSALGSRLPDCYAPSELDLIKAQFNCATPEWCMKPKPLQPKEGVWHFDDADAYVAFCKQNHIAAFGHTLVWHEDCPDWFFVDGDKPASRELVLKRLRTHIETVLTRYRGKIRGWDVVNEAISDNPKDYLRKTQWLQTIGDDYLVEAFKFAHEADPSMTLQYNDYNIETEPKRSKAIKLIQNLQSNGAHVAAIGIQAHWQVGHVPFRDLEIAINDFQKLGLKVMITELDLDMLPRKKVADAPQPDIDALTKQQAEDYAHLFRIFVRHRDVITRVAFWGIDDAHSWLNGWPYKRENHPLLFDRDAKPKPAFDAIINVAKQQSASTSAE